MMDPAMEIKAEESQCNEDHPLLKRKLKIAMRPFSRSLIFIYISVFGCKYAFIGMKTILPLYLRNILGYSENAATIIFQLFTGFSYIFPIGLGTLGDSLLGLFKANMYFSIIFTVGNVLMAAAAMSLTSLPIEGALTMFALFVMVIGHSGLSPIQTAFGGDQFDLPQQYIEMAKFFTAYYFIGTLATAIANFATPLLRNDVHCLGLDTCYSLGFAVPAAVVGIALVGFILGKRFYKMKRHARSQAVLIKTFKCIAYAVGNLNADNSGHCWLDKASEKYGQPFVNDVKRLFYISIVLVPTIIFFSLYSQMGSTWTFQATRMSGYLAPGIYIEPDQMQMMDPVFVLALIPMFDFVIYPLFGRIGLLKKPLQKMAVGNLLIALAFMFAGMLELQLEKTYPVLPATGETSFNVINALPCSINFDIKPIFIENDRLSNGSVPSHNRTILPYQNTVLQNIPVVDYNITASAFSCPDEENVTLKFTNLEYLSQPAQVHTFLVTTANISSTDGQIISSVTNEALLKSNEGDAKLRVMGGDLPANITTIEVKLTSQFENRTVFISPKDAETLVTELDPAMYLVTLAIHNSNGSTEIVNLDYVDLEQGGSYLIAIFPIGNGALGMENYVLTEPNSIHMVWQLPQYFLLTIAEVLVGISGFQFSYEQAPRSMKSLLQSVWILQNGLGNFLIVVITASNVFPNQASSFFFYFVLMIFGTIWFIICAYRYEPGIMTEESPTVTPAVTPKTRRRRKSNIQSL